MVSSWLLLLLLLAATTSGGGFSLPRYLNRFESVAYFLKINGTLILFPSRIKSFRLFTAFFSPTLRDLTLYSFVSMYFSISYNVFSNIL